MHELSLCHAVARVVERTRGERTVSRVQLRVGQLRQVVPETLCYCWELVTASSPLAGAHLDIDHVPVRLRCRDCAAETDVAHALVLVCASCGSGAVDVVAGEEFLVTTVHFAPLATTVPPRSEEN